MKAIKDAFMAWLDAEIAKENGTHPTPSSSRLNVLMQVKEKLQETINEEFAKLKEKNDAGL